MPIDEPILSPSYDDCRVRIQHTTGVVANLTLENENLPEESYDTALQDLVDVLNTAAEWTILAASKGYVGTALVTPSSP